MYDKQVLTVVVCWAFDSTGCMPMDGLDIARQGLALALSVIPVVLVTVQHTKLRPVSVSAYQSEVEVGRPLFLLLVQWSHLSHPPHLYSAFRP